MDLHEPWGISTRAVHSGPGRDRETGSLARPIYQTSTYAFEDAEELAQVASGEREVYFYTRYGHNPNQIAVAQKVAVLEGGEDGLTLASGMAAVTSCLLTALQAGDRVITFRRLYSGTFSNVTTTQSSSCCQETMPPLDGSRSSKRADIRGRLK